MSHSLRSAYMAIVIAVQEASDAASSLVGPDPLVGAAVLGQLVDDQLVTVDLDGVGHARAATGDRPAHLPRPSNSAGSSTSVKRAIA